MAFFKVGPTLKQIFMLPKMFLFFPFSFSTRRPVSAAATTPAHSQPPPSSRADHKTFKRIKVGIFLFFFHLVKQPSKNGKECTLHAHIQFHCCFRISGN
jgi:hypothetical protein